MKRHTRRQIERWIKRRIEPPEGDVQWWVLNIPAETPDVDLDDFDALILLEGRAQKIVILGDRVDSAISHFGDNVVKTGPNVDREVLDRLTTLLEHARGTESARLDPVHFVRTVGEHVAWFREERDKVQLLLEEGKRVGPMLRGLTRGVKQLQEVYVQFKASLN